MNHKASKKEDEGIDKVSQSLSDTIREVAGTLQFHAVQLLSATKPGTFENSFAGPAVYAAEHARRIAAILDDDPARDIDAVAWSVRCLYETRMLLFYLLSQDLSNATSILQKWVEQGDIQVAKTLTDLYSDSEAEKKRLAIELKTFGLPTMPKQMAFLTNCVDEHRMMYGLLCSYTHPSKWLLFGNPAIVRDADLTRVFAERSFLYLSEVQEAIAYVIENNDEVDEESSARSR